MPQIWGRYRTQGNVIWSATDLRGNTLVEHRHKHSAFFGLEKLPSTYTYTASFAVLVCRGPVSRVKRIWAPNVLLYDADAIPPTPYNIRIYLGDEVQGQDPLMVAQLGATGGAANTPAYRGACWVMFQDFPLGGFGNSIANVNPSFEVEKWGSITATVYDSFTRPDALIGTAESGQVWLQAGGAAHIVSQKGVPTAGNQCFIDAGIADATIQLTMGNRDPVNGSARIVARYLDTNNHLYWGETSLSGHYELVRKQGGLFTTITTTAITPVNGDVLKLVLAGSSLQGYVNGVLQASGTETFQQTLTVHGFGSPEDFSTVDDFSVSPLTVTSIKLSDILADLFTQSGLTAGQYDVSAATDTVSGMALQERQTANNALDGVLAIYNTQLTEVDGKIVATKRGGSVAAAPPVTDLGAVVWSPGGEPVNKVAVKRVQELELPFRLDLTYFSALTRYQAATQGAPRYTKTYLQRSVTVTAPLVLDDTTARQITETLLYRHWLEREEFTFSLPMAYLGLVPGDVLTLPVAGNLLRVRLTEVNLTVPGPLQCTAVLDDAAVLTQVVAGPDLIAAVEDAAAVIATNLIAWSGNAITDTDADSIGIYLVANGTTAGYWPGASIYWSTDGGLSYQEMDVAPDGATMGTTLTALPAGTVAGAWDMTNVLDVTITVGDIPVTTSDSDVIAGANLALVGDELLQFAIVTALGGTQYRLSRLLRGRRGTDGHWAEHRTGERFTAFDAGHLRREVLPDTLFGRSILLKALTPGQAIGDVSPVTIFVSGEEKKPYPPCQVSATRNGGLDILATWIRRTRKGAGLPSPLTIPLSEATEAYAVDILAGSPKTITAITAATIPTITSTSHGFTNGQRVAFTAILGMTQLNGLVGTVSGALTNSFQLSDLSTLYFSAYVSGGTAERIVRSFTPTSPTQIYSAANQTTDFGSTQSSIRVLVSQTGANGRGYPTLAVL